MKTKLVRGLLLFVLFIPMVLIKVSDWKKRQSRFAQFKAKVEEENRQINVFIEHFSGDKETLFKAHMALIINEMALVEFAQRGYATTALSRF